MKTILILLIACMTISAQPQKKITLQKFSENDLLVIRTQKGFSTLIEFPEDQKILEVTCGDKEFWVIEGKGRFLHVKPAKEGIVTNLNVLIEGDVIYAFLLKEISKTVNAKDGPDLRVTVNGGDELAKLRKDKDNLEEALARSERALKDLSDKYDAEKKRSPKKEDAPRRDLDDPGPNGDTPPTGTRLLPDPTSPAGATMTPAMTQGATPPSSGAADGSDEKPIASAYVIERKGGLIRKSGRLLSRFFRKVNRAIHIY
jgi:Conjugal transfer protein